MAKLTAMDKKWQAESDARTMAEYQAIMEDSSRRKAAQKMATELAKQMTTSAQRMGRAAQTSKRK